MIDEAKKDKDNQLKQLTKIIKGKKKQKVDKRSKLLQLQANQIRGKRVAQTLKRDMERSMARFDNVIDQLDLTKLALNEVQLALKSNVRNLRKFEIQLNNLKTDIESQVNDFDDIKRKMDKGWKPNPYTIKSELIDIYVQNMKSGVGMVVLSQLYDAIYTFMSELDEFPVGQYNEELNLKQNVAKFRKFVKKMNAELDGDSLLEEEEKKIQKQIESINTVRVEEGMKTVSVCSVSGKDVTKIVKECRPGQ